MINSTNTNTMLCRPQRPAPNLPSSLNRRSVNTSQCNESNSNATDQNITVANAQGLQYRNETQNFNVQEVVCLYHK